MLTHFIGSKFTPATANSASAALPGLEAPTTDGNAELQFIGAGLLPNQLSPRLNINPRNQVTFVPPRQNAIQLKISSSGRFTGSFSYPPENVTTAFKGIILQKQNLGSGFFLTKFETGSVTLAPEPPQTSPVPQTLSASD